MISPAEAWLCPMPRGDGRLSLPLGEPPFLLRAAPSCRGRQLRVPTNKKAALRSWRAAKWREDEGLSHALLFALSNARAEELFRSRYAFCFPDPELDRYLPERRARPGAAPPPETLFRVGEYGCFFGRIMTAARQIGGACVKSAKDEPTITIQRCRASSLLIVSAMARAFSLAVAPT